MSSMGAWLVGENTTWWVQLSSYICSVLLTKWSTESWEASWKAPAFSAGWWLVQMSVQSPPFVYLKMSMLNHAHIVHAHTYGWLSLVLNIKIKPWNIGHVGSLDQPPVPIGQSRLTLLCSQVGGKLCALVARRTIAIGTWCGVLPFLIEQSVKDDDSFMILWVSRV